MDDLNKSNVDHIYQEKNLCDCKQLSYHKFVSDYQIPD